MCEPASYPYRNRNVSADLSGGLRPFWRFLFEFFVVFFFLPPINNFPDWRSKPHFPRPVVAYLKLGRRRRTGDTLNTSDERVAYTYGILQIRIIHFRNYCSYRNFAKKKKKSKTESLEFGQRWHPRRRRFWIRTGSGVVPVEILRTDKRKKKKKQL